MFVQVTAQRQSQGFAAQTHLPVHGPSDTDSNFLIIKQILTFFPPGSCPESPHFNQQNEAFHLKPFHRNLIPVS